jgi:hypothetical protein
MAFLPILAKTSAVIAGTLLAGTALAYSGGVVEVCVTEKGRNPSHIHLPLPALAGPVALHFIPARHFHDTPRDLQQWLPAIRIAGEELERCPDGTVLVDVMSNAKGARETVRITKRAGDLVIDVDSARETVHVSFPVRIAVNMVGQLADEMESARPVI